MGLRLAITHCKLITCDASFQNPTPHLFAMLPQVAILAILAPLYLALGWWDLDLFRAPGPPSLLGEVRRG